MGGIYTNGNIEENPYRIEDVELEITNVCSHKCPYCYNGDLDSGNRPYFGDLALLCKIVDRIAAYGAKNIILLGGDPVTHPHLIKLLQYIKSHTSLNVTIMSNTLNFSDVTISEVASYIDEIQFTLHGATANEHENFCKAKHGTYEKVVNRMKKFISCGIEVKIVINIIPKTYDRIYDMTKSMFDQGVNFKTLLLQRIFPCGRATDSNEFNVVKKQISCVFEQLERIEKQYGLNIIFEDPFPLCYVKEQDHKYLPGCPSGINRIAIRGDGRVAYCSAVDGIDLGNILTDSYEKIWSQNNYFNKLRNLKYLTNEKCKNCQYINKCRGGCPILYMLSENMGNNFYDKFEQ